MKRLIVILLLLSSSICARAQFPYRWQIGGAMGMGATVVSGRGDFAMSMSAGFNRIIRDTRWRGGLEVGAINQGLLDYFFEPDAPDDYVRPNFIYIGLVADYSLITKGDIFTIFVRGGISAAQQADMYVHHRQDNTVPMGIVGIGTDLYFSKATICGYIAPGGIFTIQLSYGWWFGRKNFSWPEKKNGGR